MFCADGRIEQAPAWDSQNCEFASAFIGSNAVTFISVLLYRLLTVVR